MVRGCTQDFRTPLKVPNASVILVSMLSLTLPLLVIAGQVADGLAYQLAHGHGVELNPGMALLIAIFGPHAILAIKAAAGVVLGLGATALDRHRSLVTWLAVAGFVGAATELLALI